MKRKSKKVLKKKKVIMNTYEATFEQEVAVLVPVTVMVKAKNQKEAQKKVLALVKSRKEFDLQESLVTDAGDMAEILGTGSPTGRFAELELFEQDEEMSF